MLQDSASTSNFFRNCNEWSRFRKKHCNQDIDVLQNSRKIRRSLRGSCRRVVVVIPRWTCSFPSFDSCLQWNCSLCRCLFEHLNQLCDVILSPCILQFHRWDWKNQVFCNQQCCFGFPVALRILLRCPRWSCILYKFFLWPTWRISFKNTRS